MKHRHHFDLIVNIEYDTNQKGEIINYKVINKSIEVIR